jgi:hypothetical protein
MTTVEKAARWLAEVFDGEHDFNDLEPRERAHYMECAHDLILRLYGGPM